MENILCLMPSKWKAFMEGKISRTEYHWWPKWGELRNLKRPSRTRRQILIRGIDTLELMGALIQTWSYCWVIHPSCVYLFLSSKTYVIVRLRITENALYGKHGFRLTALRFPWSLALLTGVIHSFSSCLLELVTRRQTFFAIVLVHKTQAWLLPGSP